MTVPLAVALLALLVLVRPRALPRAAGVLIAAAAARRRSRTLH